MGRTSLYFSLLKGCRLGQKSDNSMSFDNAYEKAYALDMNSPIPSTLTVSDARANLYDMMEEVRKYLKRFVITHHGKPQAVLLPVEDLESWEETLDILSNKKLMADIRQAEKDFRAGRVYTLEEGENELKFKVRRTKKRTS